MDRAATTPSSIAYLGPAGTFTEEALLSQPDYAAATHFPRPTLADVLHSVADGAAALGFVPMENSIEGTVLAISDTLAFDVDLLIQREVVIDVHMALAARPGTALGDVRRVLSFPHASGQCRRFLADRLPEAEIVATSSTAEAVRIVAETDDPGSAAIGPRLAASLYGLDVLAAPVEDHPDNQTRFVAVARQGIPAATGHDKTSIVCFQPHDRPGSLHAILSEFSARGINLTKLESRPTRRGLGHYCFLIDLEGHLADEVVADCLRVLRAELDEVKFLGSYPAAGEGATIAREQATEAWLAADAWLTGLRRQIELG